MKIAIIILNWNAAADTLRCIQQIATWQRLQPEIWVVDNASTDNSRDLIAQTAPQVHLITNETNLGYAGGNNEGLSRAIDNGADFILLLNNDASINEEAVLKLVETLQNNPQVGIVGPLMYDAGQRERLLNAGGQNLIRHLTSHITHIRTTKRLQLVDYVPGTVLLSQADLFCTVGLLDEAYFFSGELPDFCERAKRQGFLSGIDTQAKAYHAVHRSSEFRETLYVYYIIRNRFRFIRKFYRFSKVFFLSFWTLYSVALAAKVRLNGQRHTATAIRLGLLDGLRGQFGGQNSRVLAAYRQKSAGTAEPLPANQSS